MGVIPAKPSLGGTAIGTLINGREEASFVIQAVGLRIKFQNRKRKILDHVRRYFCFDLLQASFIQRAGIQRPRSLRG